jgi:hypothetical protein
VTIQDTRVPIRYTKVRIEDTKDIKALIKDIEVPMKYMKVPIKDMQVPMKYMKIPIQDPTVPTKYLDLQKTQQCR